MQMYSSAKCMLRAILSSAILFALASGAVPLLTIASGPMCTLACCAGRVPHAAGSCMNGSCHASLKSQAKTKARLRRETYSEHWCGLPKESLGSSWFLRKADNSRAVVGERISKQGDSRQASLSGTTISKPCDSNCGCATFASSTQNRSRQFSALAYDRRSRPLSTSRQTLSALIRRTTHRGFGQHVSPRGPPNPSC